MTAAGQTTKLLTVREAAEVLNTSQNSVRLLITTRQLRHERHGPKGGSIRIPDDAIAEYRRSKTVPAVAPISEAAPTPVRVEEEPGSQPDPWPALPALERLLDDKGGVVKGVVAQVLEDLTARMGPETTPQDRPRTAKALSAEIRRHTPSLNRLGIAVSWPGHTSKGNLVRISRAIQKPVS